MNKVLEVLMRDLKILESTGIEVKNSLNILGSVVGVCGDNLGNHEIGGFCRNFSKNTHFCRFCYITQEDRHNCNIFSNNLRTIESYDEDICSISTNNLKIVNGLQLNSCLNELEHFHVCNWGLAPCLSHDIFEGILPVDVVLILKFYSKAIPNFIDYVNLKLPFIFKKLKMQISFPLLTKNTIKLPGKAYENWQFLLALPILLKDLEIDREHHVWKMLIAIIEIYQLTCARAITVQQTYYLQLIIEEFYDHRKIAFPTAKLIPKHHFITHYPEIIRQLGPLRVWWTMRFESKHQFFKRIAIRSHNRINITKSLAERHQLYQASSENNKSLTQICSGSQKIIERNLYSFEIP